MEDYRQIPDELEFNLSPHRQIYLAQLPGSSIRRVSILPVKPIKPFKPSEPPQPLGLTLETDVTWVRGVGPRIAEALKARGIFTAEDLLYRLPFRYEDRQHPRSLDEIKPGETASVIAEIRGTALLRTRRMPIFEMTVGQGMLAMKCVWFHGTYLQGRFQAGQTIALYGRAEASRSTRNLKMIQPQFELLPDSRDDAETRLLEVGRITPVYESLGGPQLASRWQRKVFFHLLDAVRGKIPECLPQSMLDRLGLPSRETALREGHFPPEGTTPTALMESRTPAQRRLIFEELFFLELGLELKRRRSHRQPGIAFTADDRVREALREILPFHPTAAQKRALGEIVSDMRENHPMRRLLQGDVGSGKTIVALQAMLVAIENGHQAALMAPTEILATQHYLAARKLLARSSKRYNLLLLTGSLSESEKVQARRQIRSGSAQLVFGTQALIAKSIQNANQNNQSQLTLLEAEFPSAVEVDKVSFARLGLVVIDEQHRFGVMQRFSMKKSTTSEDATLTPDMLFMTATPIPRTLALTLYGDLDTSVLDELPPGRTPIVTRRIAGARQAEVWEFVRKQVALKRQAYIVYPVIEGAREDHPELDFATAESQPPPAPVKKSRSKSKPSLFTEEPISSAGKAELRSAVEMYEQLRTGALHDLRVGLLHGRLDADEKEVLMRRFQRGEIDVLVSTTVIEVGVDVPNATVMVVDHAERFGLAQLHQLRGRVGRGAAKSYCILMTGDRVSPEAEERLAAMARTQNGFELAELDLKMRGPGEFFGTRQAGLPDFRIASLVRDRDILELAKAEATRFASHPDEAVTEAERKRVWDHLRQSWQRHYGLVEAG